MIVLKVKIWLNVVSCHIYRLLYFALLFQSQNVDWITGPYLLDPRYGLLSSSIYYVHHSPHIIKLCIHGIFAVLQSPHLPLVLAVQHTNMDIDS